VNKDYEQISLWMHAVAVARPVNCMRTKCLLPATHWCIVYVTVKPIEVIQFW